MFNQFARTLFSLTSAIGIVCLSSGASFSKSINFQINDEKKRLAYQMGVIDKVNHPDYIEKCKQIEINHIYDMFSFKEECPWFEFDNDLEKWTYDIPMKERLFEFKFDRNEEDIQRMYSRIKECREWMNENLFKLQIA